MSNLALLHVITYFYSYVIILTCEALLYLALGLGRATSGPPKLLAFTWESVPRIPNWC